MLKRDFLVAQINKFSEMVFRALTAIERENVADAEEIMNVNYSGDVLDEFEKS